MGSGEIGNREWQRRMEQGIWKEEVLLFVYIFVWCIFFCCLSFWSLQAMRMPQVSLGRFPISPLPVSSGRFPISSGVQKVAALLRARAYSALLRNILRRECLALRRTFCSPEGLPYLLLLVKRSDLSPIFLDRECSVRTRTFCQGERVEKGRWIYRSVSILGRAVIA